MSLQGFSDAQFPDHDLVRYGLAEADGEAPDSWSQYGLAEFGAYIDRPMGMIDGAALNLAMEYDEDDEVNGVDGSRLVRTKMLEMCPREMQHLRRTGRPRLGAVALADDGDVYQWNEVQGLGGFFKKLVKKAKKGLKRVHRGIKKATRKLIKKLPGGKYLVKVYDKIKKVSMKLVRPLQKLVGKFAKKLAPIAAMIPGYGPVIAAAMYKAGEINQLMREFGVGTDKKGRPKFKSGKQAKAFKRALEKKASRRGKPKDIPFIKKGQLLKRGSKAHKQRLRGLGLAGV